MVLATLGALEGGLFHPGGRDAMLVDNDVVRTTLGAVRCSLCEVGLRRNVGVQFVEDVLEHLDVSLTVLDHVSEGTLAFVENDFLPEVHSPCVDFAPESEELPQIIEAIGVEVELASCELDCVQARDVVGEHDAVLQRTSSDPLDVEAVTVVRDNFVCFLHQFDELLEHLLVVLVLVPRKRGDGLVVLPLIADANHCSFVDDVLMVDVEVIPWLPEEADVGAGLDVEKESSSCR